MATARVPRPQVVVPITVDSTLTPSPQGEIMNSTDQIEFINNAGFPINITFNPNPYNSAGPNLFQNITNLANGATSTPQSPNTNNTGNGSANYNISGNGNSNGPFSIQVGNGPIYVEVNLVGNAPVSHPATVAVPQNGTIEFQHNDNYTYPVGGLGPTLFNPAITSVDNSVHTAIGNPGTYPYTTSLNLKVAAGGGGKVKIQN